MARPFFAATAEQVIAVVEAVVAVGGSVQSSTIAEFADLQQQQAVSALGLATDLGLVREADSGFMISSPISRFLRTPQVQERAAVLRIVLECYEPFLVFREELQATNDASQASNRTKARLSIVAHREDIKSTLLGLATFSGALIAGQGGRYERDSSSVANLLRELAAGATEEGAAVLQIRTHLGAYANDISHDNILVPLAAGLRHAVGDNGREAIVHAGNAIETFLVDFASRNSVEISGATGLNSKLDRLKNAMGLPAKLVFNGKYLGHIRNAADHGVDSEIGSPWTITGQTGINYVFVSISFVTSMLNFEKGNFAI